MASCSVVLQGWKGEGDEPRLVLLRIHHRDQRRDISLGIKARPSEWNKDEQCLNSRRKSAKQLNPVIQKRKADAIATMARMQVLGMPVTADTLKTALQPDKYDENFWTFADTWLNQKRNNKQVYYWRKSRAVLNKLRALTGDTLLWPNFTSLGVCRLHQKGTREVGQSTGTILPARRSGAKYLPRSGLVQVNTAHKSINVELNIN